VIKIPGAIPPLTQHVRDALSRGQSLSWGCECAPAKSSQEITPCLSFHTMSCSVRLRTTCPPYCRCCMFLQFLLCVKQVIQKDNSQCRRLVHTLTLLVASLQPTCREQESVCWTCMLLSSCSAIVELWFDEGERTRSKNRVLRLAGPPIMPLQCDAWTDKRAPVSPFHDDDLVSLTSPSSKLSKCAISSLPFFWLNCHH
jgi:hypothetical protein